MGKKVNRSSINIVKDKKKQYSDSLIKVLRPKVYIIDRSNFKRLVQELTGNPSLRTSDNSQQLPSCYKQETTQSVPLIHIEEDQSEQGGSLEGYVMGEFDGLGNFENGFLDNVLLDVPLNDQMDDLILEQNLESWLLDFDDDPCSLFGGFGHGGQTVGSGLLLG